jgi:hypothetical protein
MSSPILSSMDVAGLPPSYDALATLHLDLPELSPSASLTPQTSNSTIDGNEDLEELPMYEPTSLPPYLDPPKKDPLVSFTITQTSSKKQTLTPLYTTDQGLAFPTYTIKSRLIINPLSNKPHVSLYRQVTSGTSTPNGSIYPPPKSLSPVAHLTFPHSTSYPWYPTGLIHYVRNPLPPSTYYTLRSPNFTDWNLRFNNKDYSWRLTQHPTTSLVLVRTRRSPHDQMVLARFAYSEFGTDALPGQDVGRFDVYEQPTRRDAQGRLVEDVAIEANWAWVEVVLASLEVVVQHWSRMGKHFKKDKKPSVYYLGL